MKGSEEYFKIGYVAKTHGLKGEVTMVMGLECPDLKGIPSIFLEINKQFVPHFIEHISVKGTQAFLKLEDVSTPERAALLKGCSIFLLKKDRPKLPRGEFYFDEVIGFEVNDKDLGRLGTVKEVTETGPNRHLVFLYGEKEVMIPLNGPFITRLDKSKKRIEVSLPDGFLDI